MLNAEQQQLVIENQKLVPFTIKRYFPNSARDEDVFSTGYEGLCIAAERYRGESESKFSTFAVFCIKSAIINRYKKEKKQSENMLLEADTIRHDNGDNVDIWELVGEKDEDPFERPDRKAVIRMIENTATLTDFEKKTIMMFLDGYIDAESAEILGCTRQAVHKSRRNGMAKVKERWKTRENAGV